MIHVLRVKKKCMNSWVIWKNNRQVKRNCDRGKLFEQIAREVFRVAQERRMVPMIAG
jgi:hypothetical protein